MSVIHPIETIISDPAIRGGQPIIAGTGVRVVDLVASYLFRGLTVEELAVNYALDLGQSHAALAYYYQHKAEMDTWMQNDEAQADRLLAELDAQGKLIRLE
jgi:uncharacterized protein (DUF433 family)